ncbi:MAG: 50S ribosomal protein L32 [Myxococcota bacterium]
MAVPKSRTSKAKKNKRRSHDGLLAPAQSTCPQCSAPKLPHRVCGSCGWYRDRTVIDTDEE